MALLKNVFFFFFLLLKLEICTCFTYVSYFISRILNSLDFLRTLLCLFLVLALSKNNEPPNLIRAVSNNGVCLQWLTNAYSVNDLVSAFNSLIKNIQIRVLADSFNIVHQYVKPLNWQNLFQTGTFREWNTKYGQL